LKCANFTPALLTVAFFIKTTKTAYELKSNEVIVALISLLDELTILLIFVNNKHFVNTVTMGKVSHADKMGNADACVNRDSEQFSKSNNSCV